MLYLPSIGNNDNSPCTHAIVFGRSSEHQQAQPHIKRGEEEEVVLQNGRGTVSFITANPSPYSDITPLKYSEDISAVPTISHILSKRKKQPDKLLNCQSEMEVKRKSLRLY
ncbi:hypothetical protein HHI36_010898 [Cryptolaemus montrouzieri]|uniref:Uncharacterized protein n=1 Tax=Cryptolaemus montrouzieri TaxID=559131 RepID=A0ABD2MK43_9CUCU